MTPNTYPVGFDNQSRVMEALELMIQDESLKQRLERYAAPISEIKRFKLPSREGQRAHISVKMGEVDVKFKVKGSIDAKWRSDRRGRLHNNHLVPAFVVGIADTVEVIVFNLVEFLTKAYAAAKKQLQRLQEIITYRRNHGRNGCRRCFRFQQHAPSTCH